MRYAQHALCFATIVLIAGCGATGTALNDAMSPSMQIFKDDFDGATIVRQEPVSAADGPSEAWHTLGFEWSQKTPDLIYITVGVHGVANITEVAFNADGQILENIKTASAHTEYGKWSTRRFVMPWPLFLAVANAKSVKMKVVRLNDYGVSSFGPNHSWAIVNSKIPPFVGKVHELRGTVK